MLRAASPTAVARLLASSSVAIPHTGTTNETVLATPVVPAGSMGISGGLEIRSVWSFTNSANSKTFRWRLGGAGGTQFMTLVFTTNAVLSDVRRIRNRGAANSQLGSVPAANAGLGNFNNPLPTGAIDTAAAVDLVITAQLASAAETITLESYEVWLLP